jgi:hypothetical protein
LHSEPDVGKYHLISFMENLVEKLSQLSRSHSDFGTAYTTPKV